MCVGVWERYVGVRGEVCGCSKRVVHTVVILGQV